MYICHFVRSDLHFNDVSFKQKKFLCLLSAAIIMSFCRADNSKYNICHYATLLKTNKNGYAFTYKQVFTLLLESFSFTYKGMLLVDSLLVPLKEWFLCTGTTDQEVILPFLFDYGLGEKLRGLVEALDECTFFKYNTGWSIKTWQRVRNRGWFLSRKGRSVWTIIRPLIFF